MKIAISATGPDLTASIDGRFGRCRYFLIVETDTMQFESIDNAVAMAAGGAGIQAAQAVAEKQVEAILTGNCGPNAYNVLTPAGIKVITGMSGKVTDAIEHYKAGNYSVAGQANVPNHHGMGR